MSAIQLWPVFICYRRVDGSVAARRLYELLDQWHTVGPEGQPIQIDAYLDETMPGVADWKALHRPYLEKARALIVVCTPGAKINDGPGDWVHMEIDWWLANRQTAPILVDPLLEGLRYVPDQIARRWPDIQRIPLVEHEWKALAGAALEEKVGAVRRQVIGAVLPSGAAIYAQELADERRRSRRLKSALLVAAALLIAVAAAATYAYTQKAAALRNERIAQASLLDSRAASLFSEASALDARRDLERARARDLTERAALVANRIASSDAPEEARILAENLSNESAQLASDIAVLSRRNAEALAEARGVLQQADTAWEALARDGVSTAERRRPTGAPIFSIELINAGAGESLLLYYGTADDPRLVMINAGPKTAFRDTVAKRLQQLSQSQFGGRPVPIELFIVGDRDADKTEGLLEILTNLAETRATGGSLVDLRGIWANIFRVDGGRETLRSHTRRLIDDLRIPLNQPFGRHVVRPATGRVVATLPGGLEIVVLGPTYERLEEVYELSEREARRAEGTIEPLAPADYTRVKIDTTPAPLTVAPPVGEAAATNCRPSDNAREQAGGAYRDASVPNRASTILLFKYQGLSFLFTGDARGDYILEGLLRTGLMEAKGNAAVDLMTIPHLGSDHNVTVDFFRRLRASGYLFSGDGTHGNPEVKTVAALVSARGCDVYRMYFVNREGRANPPGVRDRDQPAPTDDPHGAALDRFFKEENAFSPNYRRVFRTMRDGTVRIDLLTPVRF